MIHGTRHSWKVCTLADGEPCDGCRLARTITPQEVEVVVPKSYKPTHLISARRSVYLAKALYENRSLKEVAELTGLSHTAVRLLVIGATTHVYPSTQEALERAIPEAAMLS